MRCSVLLVAVCRYLAPSTPPHRRLVEWTRRSYHIRSASWVALSLLSVAKSY